MQYHCRTNKEVSPHQRGKKPANSRIRNKIWCRGSWKSSDIIGVEKVIQLRPTADQHSRKETCRRESGEEIRFARLTAPLGKTYESSQMSSKAFLRRAGNTRIRNSRLERRGNHSHGPIPSQSIPKRSGGKGKTGSWVLNGKEGKCAKLSK